MDSGGYYCGFKRYPWINSTEQQLPLLYREHSDAHKGEAKKSLLRATALIGMAPDIDPSTYDHSETDRYGTGKGIHDI